MSEVSKVVKFELSKIYGRKKYIVLSIILIAISVFAGLVSSGFGLGNLIVKNFTISANLPLSMLPIFTAILLPLSIYMLCSDLISEEFGNGSIKGILLRPVNRFQVYLGKIIAVVLYTFFNLLILMVASIVINAIVIKSFSNFPVIVIAFIISILPMISFICFGTMISSFVKNSSMAMFLMILLSLGLNAINFLFGSIGSTFFTTYTGFYKLFIGSRLPVSNIISIGFLIISTSLIFYILGFLTFDKKEV